MSVRSTGRNRRTGSLGQAFDLAAIKSIAITTILKDLGVRVRSAGTANCPFPDHLDKTPSFQARTRTNTWACYGCSRSGSTIDFIMQLYGYDFVEAAVWLQKRYFGSAVGRARTTALPVRKLVRDEAETSEIYRTDSEVYEWIFGSPDPNDTLLDPPTLRTLNDFYSGVLHAQRILEQRQITVLNHQPRQLIPISIGQLQNSAFAVAAEPGEDM